MMTSQRSLVMALTQESPGDFIADRKQYSL